jgi:hypothetical protein
VRSKQEESRQRSSYRSMAGSRKMYFASSCAPIVPQQAPHTSYLDGSWNRPSAHVKSSRFLINLSCTTAAALSPSLARAFASEAGQ